MPPRWRRSCVVARADVSDKDCDDGKEEVEDEEEEEEDEDEDGDADDVGDADEEAASAPMLSANTSL